MLTNNEMHMNTQWNTRWKLNNNIIIECLYGILLGFHVYIIVQHNNELWFHGHDLWNLCIL